MAVARGTHGAMDSIDQVGGFVMAGGQSSRMGRDKALLELEGVPLVVRAARLVESVTGAAAVIGQPETFRALHLRAIADDWPGAGPLGGIATALRATEAPWNLVVACDLPYLTKEWLEFLVGRALASQADSVVPMSERGAEPLCAMYHKRCESAVWLALDRGTRKVTDCLAGVHVEHIEQAEWKGFDSEGLLFKNINSAQDYEEAKGRLEGDERR
jgi:molybdopterin-guanine dinucleotide biosynthesis protein A